MLFDAPGVIFSYQNANFILAGAMLERCTGKAWEDLMTTELFQPLGITTAGFGAPGSASNAASSGIVPMKFNIALWPTGSVEPSGQPRIARR